MLVAADYTPDRPTTGWTIAAWLKTPDSLTGGMTPLSLLKAGHQAKVLVLARDMATSLGVQERASVQSRTDQT